MREFGFKQETFAGPSWTAIVGFCGVALTSAGTDTGKWLLEQREAFPFQTGTYDDFIQVLLSAQKWWGRLAGPPEELTFIVTGMVDGFPTTSIVSNVARVDGPDLAARGPTLVASTARVRGTKVLVRGIGSELIRRNDRQALVRLAERGGDPEAVRLRLAAINGRVARSPLSHGGVTEACMVAHLPSAGTATFVPYGTAASDGDFIPNEAKGWLEAALASGAISRQVGADGKPLALRMVQGGRVVSPAGAPSVSIAMPRDVGGVASPTPSETPPPGG